MIGIDWGTSSFRAFRMDEAGNILNRLSLPRGILHVESGRFAATMQTAIAPWLAAGERRILLSGMIGSRQGWVEAPYLPCPAGAADIAAALVGVPAEGLGDGMQVQLVPGLSDTDESGTPEVMRGEETQIVGVISAGRQDFVACLPGSHSKWARVAGGRIVSYRTYLSGEAFAALRGGTILGRMMQDAPPDFDAFDRGVARAGEAGHLLHHLFGVRTLGLAGRLADTASASYLSGLLVGHEVRGARPGATPVHLIGAAPLCALYARAIAACGGSTIIENEEAAASGLARIARSAQWN
jgi:2-dehydro-3-deoxygalactonokinase